MKLYESITKSLKENEWEDALRAGKVINVSNKAKNYAPTDFKYTDDKVYYRSGALTGNNWIEHPKNLEDILKHFDNQTNEEGSTITIADDTEPTIDMNKVIDNDMSIKELDDTAQWLYDNNRDEWDKFTDNELRELANLCHTGKWGRAYDDEVFDEMTRRGITLQESNLKEATGSKRFFVTKFADNADRNGEEVEIVNYKDNGRLDIKFVSDGKLLKNVYDNEVKRVAYNVDGDNVRMIASDLGEYQDKIINYIKNLKESNLKEMENSEGLTNIQFVEYCKDKLTDLGTVKVKNFDDEDVDVKVAFEQPIRNYGMCKVLDSEDTIDKLDSDGETLEFVDEKGEYHNSPMISPITLVGRLEFDRIDNEFYKSILQYWDDISDFFESEDPLVKLSIRQLKEKLKNATEKEKKAIWAELNCRGIYNKRNKKINEGDAYDTNEDARPLPAVDKNGEPYNDGSRIDPRTGERFFGGTVAEEYQAEVDKCLAAYNNKNLDTAYKAWCQLHEILDKRLDSAGPKDDDRFPLYKEWQTYIDKIPKDAMYEITDYGKNKIYAEEYGLKEADGSRLIGGRYRTMSELRDLFKEYAEYFETKGNRIKGNTPEASYNRGWELGKADAYKLATFEIENNVDPSLLREADSMNTTSPFIDIKEIIKYAENYLMEKLNATASIVICPDGQYTLTIPNTDKVVADYLKLRNDLHLWEAEKLNEGNYGSIWLAEILYNGVVGTCRGIGKTPEEAQQNAFALFRKDYPEELGDTLYKYYKEKGLDEKIENTDYDHYDVDDAFNAIKWWYDIDTFDMSSGATNEGGSTLKESAGGYVNKLGGDPEDFISDIQSIKDKLNELDTDKFATKLAYEVWEQFDDTCDYQIKKTKDVFLSESEKKTLAVESWTFTE